MKAFVFECRRVEEEGVRGRDAFLGSERSGDNEASESVFRVQVMSVLMRVTKKVNSVMEMARCLNTDSPKFVVEDEFWLSQISSIFLRHTTQPRELKFST